MDKNLLNEKILKMMKEKKPETIKAILIYGLKKFIKKINAIL